MHIGIDLGTSNSAIVAHTGASLRLIKTSEGSDVLPSCVYVDQRGRRFVGARAYEQAAANPDNVAREFKRLMGTSTPLRLAGGDVVLSPEEASAEILRTLMAQARTELGDEPLQGSVITTPAAFNQMQTEATLSAAEIAGIAPVGLLQEPIAAAMASMANSQVRSGQFLVYDLGGGTFDVALVQSSGGSVNILAHEGVNMLGGKDFDEALMREIVCPWLEANFALPEDYRLAPEYERVLKRVKLKAERAKIELSASETSSIFMADEDLRIIDGRGREIYVDIDFSRSDLERLVKPNIDRSIQLCLKVIQDNNLTPGDLDRVVLIGGPSKMPIVRRAVPEALGIPADLATDPMTAVATGAAIYAESREWGAEASRRKASRASQTAGAELKVKYDYPARTADDTATIRVSAAGSPAGWRVKIDGFDGWSSGEVPLSEKTRVDVPIGSVGENKFRATVTGPGPAVTAEITIIRTFASSAGVPAMHDICMSIEQDLAGQKSETLARVVAKGTSLPATGHETFRAARAVVGGSDDWLDFRFYEAPVDITDPGLSQFVGNFHLSAKEHIEPGATIRQGDAIVIRWTMSDSGVLTAEAEFPRISAIVDLGRFQSQAGHKDFSGDEGAQLADQHLAEAADAVEEVQDALGETAWFDLQQLKGRLETQRDALTTSHDPDVRRQAAEEALAVRQEIARIRTAPANRSSVISRDLAEAEENYEQLSEILSSPELEERLTQLSNSARRLLNDGAYDQAAACVTQMRRLVYLELTTKPVFLVTVFQDLASERFAAIDKGLHDKLVDLGRTVIDREDWDALRRVIGNLTENRFTAPPAAPVAEKLTGVVK
jgi:molecular chaperone DnaK